MAYQVPATAAAGGNVITDVNTHKTAIDQLQAKFPNDLTGLVKANGSGVASTNAVAGTDYAAALTPIPVAANASGMTAGQVRIADDGIGGVVLYYKSADGSTYFTPLGA